MTPLVIFSALQNVEMSSSYEFSGISFDPQFWGILHVLLKAIPLWLSPPLMSFVSSVAYEYHCVF